jgi:hypothetical protein
MAEIPLQQEKKTSVWVWLIPVLIVAAVAAWLLSRRNARNDAPETTSSTETRTDTTSRPDTAAGQAATSTEATDFFTFMDQARRPPNGGVTAEQYTADGIRRLAAALASKNMGGVEILTMRQAADSLQRNADVDQQAAIARKAFEAAAAAMGNVSGAEGAKQAAEAIRPDRPLGEQTDQVTAFFEKARDALRASA